MGKPFISVIIPVYNTSQYLDQCLDSLVNQTFRDIEIICINDGSTDDSLQKLEFRASKDERIKVINSTENLKLGTARNTGIKEASGTYIGFVDSDDYVSEQFYQFLVDALENDADVVTANLSVMFGTEEQLIRRFNKIPDSQDAIKREIAANGCRLWLSIFKKSYLINNHLLFPERVVYDDNAIALCMFLLANRIIVADNDSPAYFYRINPTSIVHGAFTEEKLSDRMATAKMIWNNMGHYDLMDTYHEEFQHWFCKSIYRNTIALLLYKTERYSCDSVRYVYCEYRKIAGKFPYRKKQKDIKHLWLYITIGKYPFLGYIIRILRKKG